MFYVVYPPAEISHWNRLVTSELEFWKWNKSLGVLEEIQKQGANEIKTLDVLDEIKKKQD